MTTWQTRINILAAQYHSSQLTSRIYYFIVSSQDSTKLIISHLFETQRKPAQLFCNSSTSIDFYHKV